jgi:hypothetical protein
MGENFRSADVMKPTVRGGPATTNPPLLATPGGVRSVHDVSLADLRNNSQKVLAGSWRRPMAIASDDSVGVAAEALMAKAGPPDSRFGCA